MNHWNDTMVDRPDPNGPAYLAGWTISGLAVIGTILAVWVLAPDILGVTEFCGPRRALAAHCRTSGNASECGCSQTMR